MTTSSREILIVPFDFHDEDLIWGVERRVAEVFAGLGVAVTVDSPVPLPPTAYDPWRDQCSTAPLLDALDDFPTSAARILGIASIDIYAPELPHVFGQARMPGRAGVISIARLKQEFYSLPADKSLLLSRACKEAIHELGHTFGLYHCRVQRCVMIFSHNLQDTDVKSDRFCRQCLAGIGGFIKKFRNRHAFVWLS